MALTIIWFGVLCTSNWLWRNVFFWLWEWDISMSFTNFCREKQKKKYWFPESFETVFAMFVENILLKGFKRHFTCETTDFLDVPYFGWYKTQWQRQFKAIRNGPWYLRSESRFIAPKKKSKFVGKTFLWLTQADLHKPTWENTFLQLFYIFHITLQ